VTSAAIDAAALDALRQPVVALAREAGAAIMAVYASDFAVERKDDRSPLTEADLAAHRVIVDGLAKLTPGWPVLSEEGAGIAWTERSRWTRYWLVDPLDGTREFVKRNGEFTVNIALIEDGAPVLGVVHAPARGDLVHAVHGGAALAETATGTHVLRSRQDASLRPRVAGSRSHGDPRLTGFLARLGEHDYVALGSSLKFCLVAAGEADVYLRYGATSEWDTAAGQCIVEAAGGAVVDLAGRRLAYNRKDSLINPDFLVHAGAFARWRPLLEGEPA
jgi:3'(2'), 5'-bisphosphate nucleotidase